MDGNQYDILLKMVLVGEMSVGKSCLLLRYAEDTFNETHITTIGVDFKIRTLKIDDKIVKLQIWDTAGQERFRTITSSYYKGSHGILLVFDITDRRSFDNLGEWYEDIQNYANEKAVSKEEALEVAQRMQAPYIETSARENINISRMFEQLIDVICNGYRGNTEYYVHLSEVVEREPYGYSFGLCDKFSGGRVHLESIAHQLTVNDFCATVRSEYAYVNTSEQNVELVYRFPLLHAMPCDLVCEFIDCEGGKEVVRGKVREKSQCVEKYDDIVAEGNTAVLLERQNDSVYTLQLGNVQTGTRINVLITTVQELPVESLEKEGEICIRAVIPALDPQARGKGDNRKVVGVKSDIWVSCGASITGVKCPGVDITVKKHASDFYEVSSVPFSCCNNFELNIHVAKYPAQSVLVQKCPVSVKYRYPYVCATSFLLSPQEFKIEAEYVEKLCVVLIVDNSGSMSGTRMKMTKTALRLLVQSFDVNRGDIIVNVVKFGSSMKKLYERAMKLNQRTYDAVCQFIQDMDSNMGGTDILTPVTSVLDELKVHGREKYAKNVILVTDGEDSAAAKIISRVKKDVAGSSTKSARFFTFTIGSNVNPFLCDELARITEGRSCSITEMSSINSAVIAQVKHLTTGNPIKNVCVSVVEPSQCDVWKNEMKRGWVGTGYTQFVFVSRIPKKVKVEFTAGGKQYEKVLEEVSEVSSGKQSLGVLAVQERIQWLEKGKSLGADSEIIDLAMQFNLVSSKTALLLQRENEEPSSGEILLERVSVAKKAISIRGGSRGGFFSSMSQQNEMDMCCAPDRVMLMDAPQEQSKGCCGGGGGGQSALSSTIAGWKESIASRRRRGGNNDNETNTTTGELPMNTESEGSGTLQMPATSSSDNTNSGTQQQKQKPKRKQADYDRLMKLLLKQTLQGLWIYEPPTLEYLDGCCSLTLRDVKKLFKGEVGEDTDPIVWDYWTTALVCEYVKQNFPEKSDEWMFIVLKSENLVKVKHEAFLKDAEEVIKKVLKK